MKTESVPETKRRTDYVVKRLEGGQWRNVNCFEDLSRAIDCLDKLKARYAELRIIRMDSTVILTEVELAALKLAGKEWEFMSKKAKGSWVVLMECTIKKEVICDGCTEEQAKENPWAFASQERELDMSDWEVQSVKENE